MFDIDKKSIYWPDNFIDTLLGNKTTDNLSNILLQSEIEFLLHPRNMHNLLMPVTDEIFVKNIYNEMVNDGIIKEISKSLINSIMPHVNVRKSRVFVGGKSMVGPLALSVTGHSVKQADEFDGLSKFYVVDDVVFSSRLRFAGMEDVYSMASYTDSKGNIILEATSQALSIAVDNVKNPVADDMFMNMQTIGTIGYLLQRGIDPKTVLYFINQPIIKKYLRAQKANEAFYNKEFGNEISKAQLIDSVLSEYMSPESIKNLDLVNIDSEWTITFSQLKSDILSNSNQVNYLVYFLQLLDQAKLWSQYNATQNSDTATVADRQQLLNTFARQDNVRVAKLVSAKQMDNANSVGLIAPFYKYGRMTYDIYRPFYKVETSNFGSFLNQHKVDAATFAKARDKDIVIQTIENDFLLFVIQNFVLSPADKDRLMKGGESLPHRIAQAKIQYPSNLILKAFTPLLLHRADPLDSNRISNLRLFDRQLSNLDQQDLLTQIDQLATADSNLYEDLVKLLFFQSGLNLSPFNYKSIIPVGLESQRSDLPDYYFTYQDIIQEGVKKLNTLPTDLYDSFMLLFDMNNPKYLRGKVISGHTLKKKYIKGKTILSDTNGKNYPVVGDSFQKNYNLGLVTVNVPTPSIPNDPSVDETLKNCE